MSATSCTYCGESISSKSLKRHIQRKHAATVEAPPVEADPVAPVDVPPVDQVVPTVAPVGELSTGDRLVWSGEAHEILSTLVGPTGIVTVRIGTSRSLLFPHGGIPVRAERAA